MMFDLAPVADMTARTIQARDEKRGREETFVADQPARRFEETRFLVYSSDIPSVRRNGTLTPTVAELRRQTEPMPAPAKEAGVQGVHDNAADRARDARVALLARKYEGLSTVEDDARLAILTARLRKLTPRVTSADLDKLTTMVGELEDVSANLDAIRSKFGLK
jgi:hypothetical protein